MTTLHSWHKENCTLIDALQGIDQELIGYCMSPQHFRFTRILNGDIETAEPLALDQVYEARFCNETVELRWLRNPENKDKGDALLLMEESASLPSEWKMQQSLKDLETLDGQRLMTGTLGGDADKPGWRMMDAPRHGKVAIPFSGEAGEKMKLAWNVREYIGNAPGLAGEDKNRMVIEERILGVQGVMGSEK